MFIGQKIDKLTIIEQIGKGTKVKAICECGNIWTGYLDLRYKTHCCDKCRLPKIGKRYNNLTIIEVLSKSKVKCLCDCGNSIVTQTNRLRSNNTKSCGCLVSKTSKKNRIDLTGQRFGRLTVIKYLYSEKSKNGKSTIPYYQCKCDCGNEINVTGHRLKTGNTKSCGCYQKDRTSECNTKDITGNKYGKLIVTKLAYRKNKHTYWQCRCKCGNLVYIRQNSLVFGNTKSCGDCHNIRNGKFTSFKALKVHQMIGRGVHNYKTKLGYYIDIAFILNGYKIALEYDEWYWHKDKIKQDNKRYNNLIKDGWKIINIKAHRELPTQIQINDALNKILSKNKVIITLPNWKKKSKIYREVKKC